jgi:DNA-binding MarR family transcriptional regulator
MKFEIPVKVNLTEHAMEDRRKFVVVPYRAIQDPRLRPASLRVLMQCAAYANKAGFFWVGMKRLGQDLGVSNPAIHRQIKKLRELGYLERIKHGRRGVTADTHRIIYAVELSAQEAAINAGGLPDHLRENKTMSRGKQRKVNINKVRLTGEDKAGTELVDGGIETSATGPSPGSEGGGAGAPGQVLPAAARDPLLILQARYAAEGLSMPTGARLDAELQAVQREIEPVQGA